MTAASNNSISPKIIASGSESYQLNRKNEVPLHRQFRQLVEAKIESGEWQLGTLIPREIDLVETYGLSRYTIRQALDELAQAGYLVRSKKKGTMVSRPKVEQELSQFYSFAHDMEAKGLKPISFVLALTEVSEPDENTVRALGLEDFPAKLYLLRRLRIVGDEPLVIETSYLAFAGPVNLYNFDWRVLPLYDVLEEHYGIKVARAEEFLEPVCLEPQDAQLLGVSPGTPAFRVERLTYDEQGRVFERRISLIRGDCYRFKVELLKKELVQTQTDNIKPTNKQTKNE